MHQMATPMTTNKKTPATTAIATTPAVPIPLPPLLGPGLEFSDPFCNGGVKPSEGGGGENRIVGGWGDGFGVEFEGGAG